MSTKEDYYKTLGLTRSANKEDIKKAYRRLAVKWHPDKNPNNRDEADKKFKQIAEAYQVLSDDSKRSMYNQYGHGNTGFSGGFDGMHDFAMANDIFKHFFGNNDPFAELFSDDPFNGFQNAFGGSSFSSFSSSSFGGCGGSFAQSISSTTTVQNGVRVTRKKTTSMGPNGIPTTSVIETHTTPDGQTAIRNLSDPNSGKLH